MRNVLVALLLVVLLLGGVGLGFYLLWRSEVPPRPQGDVARIEDELSLLRGHLEELRVRVESVEVQLAQERLTISEPGGGPGSAPGGGRDPSATRLPPGEERPSTAGPSPDGMPSAAPVLLPEEEQLRQLVLTWVEEDRRMREEEARRTAEERRREFEEMRKGPYGRHNYQVNSMSKKLGLNENQKELYYRVLTDFSERMTELGKGVNWSDAEARAVYHERRKATQAEFEQAVGSILTQEQNETFLSLPQWQRGPRGGVVLSTSSQGDAIRVEGTQVGAEAIRIETVVPPE